MAITVKGATVIKGATTIGFSPASLFAAGEQGVWYDPSDLSTLFQDSAGTTPVTAVEQPVGLIRDKSGRGNHASQSTSAARPVLSARVNLLTKTEQFDDAAWPKDNATVSSNTTTAPDGTSTADTLFETAVNNQHLIYQAQSATVGVNYEFKVYMKANQRSFGVIQIADSSSPPKRITVLANLSTGAISTTRTIGSPAGTSSSITSVGSGWYLVSAKMNQATGSTIYVHCATSDSGTPSWNAVDFPTYLGDVTKGIYVWGADLRASNDGVGLPVYQRVNTSTDYDTSGFPLYLAFNGTSSNLATSSINFSAGNKVSVFSGMRNFTSSAATVITELSDNINNNNGAFNLVIPTSASINCPIFRSKGTVLNSPTVSNNTYTPPISLVISGFSDISAPSLALYTNSSLFYSDAITQGTGNYGNYPLYVGSRGGSAAYFSGRIYSLIIRGAASTSTQRTSTEAWVNQKTRAY